MPDMSIEELLMHHGVKGMHWGVRQARADANEHTKAKLFYGEGAGTRRKLIAAKVAQRSKDPAYKKAFDEHVAKQNLSRRASQARVTRTRKDVVSKTTKTVKGVHRSLTGGFGSVSLASATIAGAYAYAHKTGLDKKLISQAQAQFKKTDYSEVAAWLKSQGVG